ncbi:MAG: methylated-DNA--[protein]-cysteine S-methyltransferase, partial [Actinomycetota bacterium]|nr:methylated-DNA--[protein]-cysteine S-methyltransferase [Actinomycetota bacterium]
GELTLVATDQGLRAVLWPGDEARVPLPDDMTEAADHVTLVAATNQLVEYFSGQRQEFDLPLDLRGTEFQRSAWRALADIPYGETASYGEQAARIGRPTAVRAVGAANGRNPISIVLPCHRVVGSNGSLTGFAGGLDSKRLLLQHEGALGDPMLPLG